MVVLDPDEIAHPSDLNDLGEPELIDSPWSLRRAFELSGRVRRADDRKLVLLVHARDLAEAG